MNRLLLAVFTVVLIVSQFEVHGASAADKNMEALLRRMSLDEKIGQMTQIDLGILAVAKSSPLRLDEKKLREALVTYKVGSLFNTGGDHALSVGEWHSLIKSFQDMIRAETPHKIPLLYGIDSMHGANYVLNSTLFPQGIGMAATRNPDLMRRCAEISAAETRAAGLRWNFAPVLDVGRQALWSRFPETFGEDPYLCSVLGVATVRGFQGDVLPSDGVFRPGDSVTVAFSTITEEMPPHVERIKENGTITLPFLGPVRAAGKTTEKLQEDIRFLYVPRYYTRLTITVKTLNTTVAACAKHYLGYSFPFSGKDRTPALIPDSHLREYFLPSFREALKAGAKTVMVDSGEVNGVPVHASEYLLTDVLRGELGFQGVIVSDWQDIIRLHTLHRVAATPKEAVLMAVDAGVDMSMVPLDYSFFTLLKELVQEGRVSKKRIDQSVRRILQLKSDVGLFKNPYAEPEAAGNFGKPEYRQVALQAAEESLTLLKNEQAALPLSKSIKVLVAGPAAQSISALHGCWSYTWLGKDEKWYPKDTLTIVDAIREKIGTNNVMYRQGADFDGKLTDADAATSEAANADAIILCLGEDAYAETPGDISDLNLPAGQQELAKRLYATGKPVVLVLVEGRGRVIREIEPGAKGILMAYWPGSQGARAVANVLFGDTNPSGKLPFSYARYANHLVTYDRKGTERVEEDKSDSRKAVEYKPQWEFGQGLGYTTFEFKNLKLSAPVLKGKAKLSVSVDVTNTGARSGKQTVELYTRDLYASLTPPMKRLRAFKKIELESGQTKTVNFELTAADLAFVNSASKLVTEPGDFELMIANLKEKFRFEK